MVVKIQALIRRFLQRRKYKVRQINMEKKAKYFKVEESKETVNFEPFNQNAPLVHRKYTYKTGAIYSGQWKGGLRHGQGVMTWPDGAKYEGMWELN